MKAPTCIKDVQKLTGCMAALKRFISKLGERGLPFFKLLKHQEKFAWTPEADQALAQLKDFLSKPPVLTAPHKKEQLLLLTPKIGTGEGLTCGPSLVTKYHSAGKIFSEDSVRDDCGRQCTIIRQKDYLRF
jgi:hypothetical protein